MNVPLPRMLRSYQQRSATWLYERDAAFLAAERLLKEAGLTWYELLDVSEKELRKK